MNSKPWGSLKMFVIGLIIIAILMILSPGIGYATENDCRYAHDQCGHTDGTDGADGADGVDGIDGRDGKDGIDGKDGVDGIDGRDGADGIVPTTWITETRNNFITVNKWYREAREAAAVAAAMQVHLPQEQASRLTFGMSRLNNTTGVGVGYAYRLDNARNTALTLAVGMAGNETAVKGSFGFEFGGDRRMEIPAIVIAPEPVGGVVIPEAEYETLLMAQVQYEEFEKQKQMVEDKFAKYDNLIQAQQKEIEYQREELAAVPDDREELERLKQMAADREAAEKARAAVRASVRARYAKKAKEKDDDESNDK